MDPQGQLLVASDYARIVRLEDAVVRRIDPVTGAGQVLTAFNGFVTGLAVVPGPLATLPASAGPDPDHDGFADPDDNASSRFPWARPKNSSRRGEMGVTS